MLSKLPDTMNEEYQAHNQINLPVPELDVQSGPSNESMSRAGRMIKGAKLLVETGVVITEVTPLNEMIRYGAFALSVSAGNGPLVSGVVLGATNMLIESSAALATADLMSTDKSAKALGWINSKMRKVMPKAKMNPAFEAGVAYLGGSAVVMLAKQIEDPARTINQNRKYGLFTAGWLSTLLTAQGVLASNAITDPNVVNISAGITGTAGVIGIAQWAKKRFSR
jgi:hypothetical protein